MERKERKRRREGGTEGRNEGRVEEGSRKGKVKGYKFVIELYKEFIYLVFNMWIRVLVCGCVIYWKL